MDYCGVQCDSSRYSANSQVRLWRQYHLALDAKYGRLYLPRCEHTYTSPISIIDPPNPPVSQYSLGDEATTTGCGSERVLKTTVTEEHSYTTPVENCCGRRLPQLLQTELSQQRFWTLPTTPREPPIL